jgi:hypothetical protein
VAPAPDPHEPDRSREAAPDEGPPPQEERADEPFEPSLLAEVLRQTADAEGQAEPVPRAVVESLREVFRRHEGRSFDLASAAEDLVEAVLRDQFPGDAEELRRAAARELARVLIEDPTSRERIEKLWSCLKEQSE